MSLPIMKYKKVGSYFLSTVMSSGIDYENLLLIVEEASGRVVDSPVANGTRVMTFEGNHV